jgi:hypothetical protein
MKAKLVKTENGYGLEDVEIIAFYSSKRPEHKHYKLSKQNCDLLFGVFDVDDMMKNILSNCSKTKEGYILGFKMAIALNKDKVFALEDMRNAIQFGLDGMFGYEAGEEGTTKNQMKRFIQSLQQPTEIEVEIVMDICGDKVYAVPELKLDENGCLILKKF